MCFISAAISAPGAWLSCLSRLDVRTASLRDVLWANKWLIDWLIEPCDSGRMHTVSTEIRYSTKKVTAVQIVRLDFPYVRKGYAVSICLFFLRLSAYLSPTHSIITT